MRFRTTIIGTTIRRQSSTRPPGSFSREWSFTASLVIRSTTGINPGVRDLSPLCFSETDRRDAMLEAVPRASNYCLRNEHWTRHPKTSWNAVGSRARHRYHSSFHCTYESPHHHGPVAERLYLSDNTDRSDSRSGFDLEKAAVWICFAYR